ncbi:MAG: ThiF family adenylyltransferase [bacterium]|jgi:molybdopterin/thiamine biosynthesis adenylyltransferase|nr:ThiF family adenylyltransferase [bacterium]
MRRAIELFNRGRIKEIIKIMEECYKERYSRQMLFQELGDDGQERLARSKAAVIGCGALGTVIASGLARAGIGRLVLIDRDVVEWSNLPRQMLFEEKDVGLPKAVAAEMHLKAVNSAIEITGLVTDFNSMTAESLIAEADIVLDGTDNFAARFLMNDTCLKLGIPWIYGAVLGATGCSLTIQPDHPPCLRCLMPEPPEAGSFPSCHQAGVINPAPGLIGAVEVAETLKVLSGVKTDQRLLEVDLWQRNYRLMNVSDAARIDCPACNGRYDYLHTETGGYSPLYMGEASVQLYDTVKAGRVDLDKLAGRLSGRGKVCNNGYVLSLRQESRSVYFFTDGRVIVRGMDDPAQARQLLKDYIGTSRPGQGISGEDEGCRAGHE